MNLSRVIVGMGAAAMAAMVLPGCDSSNKSAQNRPLQTLSGPNIVRVSDPAAVQRGLQIYRQHCTRCHGADGEGARDWRRPGPDGKYPPPPLDSTAHAWHHPLQDLHAMIKFGTPPDKGNMPAWKDQLSDKDIDDVISWIQSLWTDEVYAAWYEMTVAR